MVAEISDQHDSEWAPSVTWSWARARASRTAAATMRWLSTLNNSKFGTIWGPQMPKRAGPQRSSRTSDRGADTGQIWIGGLGVLPAAPPPTVNLGAGGDYGYDEAHDIGAS